jgi:hypothetical protein
MLLLAASQLAVAAAPVVIANHTGKDIVATVSAVSDRPQRVTVDRRDFTVLTVSGGATVSFISDGRLQTTRIEEGCAYAFNPDAGAVKLEPLYDVPAPRGAHAKDQKQGAIAPRPVATLTIKLLVDRLEPAVRAGPNGWENRLRKRVAAASEVLERQCHVRLEVVAVDVWDTSANARDLAGQMSDFESSVPTRPAQLAIGFFSRVLAADATGRVAAPPAVPLGSHILIDEGMPLAESQRLEVLVHELGHLLGAVHTKDAESVMRLSPGDGRSTMKGFRIGFDPLNALAINLVAAEAMKSPPVRKLGALSASTRRQLTDLYKEMARQMPEDQAVERYLRLLDDVPPPRQPNRAASDPLIGGARTVVAAIVSATEVANELGMTGDRVTEHCVRAAAAAAGKLPEEQRVSAFLLGLAVAFDTSDQLRKAETTRGLWLKVENDDERRERLKMIGQPTLQGRHRLARHFVVAAALTSIAGAKAADPGGIVSELFDSESSGAFSFSEMAVELAGAAFARSLSESPGRLESIAGTFSIADYTPPLSELDDAISRDEFNRRFGSYTDERFRTRETEIRRRISELPAHKPK